MSNCDHCLYWTVKTRWVLEDHDWKNLGDWLMIVCFHCKKYRSYRHKFNISLGHEIIAKKSYRAISNFHEDRGCPEMDRSVKISKKTLVELDSDL